MKKKTFLSILGTVVFGLVGPLFSPVSAGNDFPQLPSCPNPGGTQVAGYADGMHQIPGGDLLLGSDYVYRVGDDNFVQCFCHKVGNAGIQSNWVHEKNLTPSEEADLLSNGWIKINNGQDWGLPAGYYLVKNSSFDCTNCKVTINQKSETVVTTVINGDKVKERKSGDTRGVVVKVKSKAKGRS